MMLPPGLLSHALHRAALRRALRAQQDARAAHAQEIYGDAFAGINERGQIVLWRKTTIPAVPGKTKGRPR